MRPITTGPCSKCGCTLTHDEDPWTVLCDGCERAWRPDAETLLAQAWVAAGGTVSTRRVFEAPLLLEPGYRVLTLGVVFTVGFLLGWLI